MKCQLACQDAPPQDVGISHFKFLTSMLEEDQLIDQTQPLKLDYDLETFQAYQAFMDQSFKPQTFQTSFIEMAIMLDDDRFPDLIKNYRSSVLAGQLGLGQLKFEHLSIIFGCLEKETYSLGQIGRFLESKKIRTSWPRLYPFFPIIKVQDWQMSLLIKSYELDPNYFRSLKGNLELINYKPIYLDWSASYGLIKVVTYLISHFKIKRLDLVKMDYSPLIRAIKQGHFEMVQYLVNHFSLKTIYIDYRISEYLFLAAKGGCLDIFKFLCSSWNLSDNLVHSLKGFILVQAIRGGHLAIVQYICHHYFSQDFFNNSCIDGWKRGVYVLENAIRFNQINLIEFLIDFFSLDRESIKNSISQFLILAVTNDNLELVSFLIRKFKLTLEKVRSDHNQALIQAASQGHLEILKFLVEEYPLTAEDARSQNNRALQEAVAQGHLDTVKFLVSRFGLTLFDLRISYKQAILEAIRAGHLQTIQYLCQLGLTLNDIDGPRQDSMGLCIASAQGHLEIIKFLHAWFNLSDVDLQGRENEILRVVVCRRRLPIFIYICQNLDRNNLEPSFADLVVHVASTGWLEPMDFLCTHFELKWSDDWLQVKSAYRKAMINNRLGIVEILTQRLNLNRFHLEEMATRLTPEEIEDLHSDILNYFESEFGLRLG